MMRERERERERVREREKMIILRFTGGGWLEGQGSVSSANCSYH